MILRIDFDSHRFKTWLSDLEKKQIPYAISGALNGVAFRAQRAIRANLKKKYTLRNKYTEKSIRVEKAKKNNLQSIVGTEADYLLEHETGGIFKNKKSRNYSVPQQVRRTKRGIVSKSKYPSRLKSKNIRLTNAKNRKGKILLQFQKGKKPIVLWAFEPQKKIKKTLFFQETAEKIGTKYMPIEFQKSFEYAMRTAKK